MTWRKIIISVAAVLFLATTANAGVEGGNDRPLDRRFSGRGPESQPDKLSGRRNLAATMQHEDRLLEWIRQIQPEHHKQLIEIKKADPRLYWWAMRENMKWYPRSKSVPADLQDQLFKQQGLRLQAWQLAEKLRSTDSDQDKDKLRSDLREILAGMFILQQEIRYRQLAILEQQIKLIRADLEQQAKRRDQIIQERLQQMLNPPQNPSRHGPDQPTTKPAD